ncbi:MAG: GGDEF domain-containing protein [Rhizobiaceae bacterium]
MEPKDILGVLTPTLLLIYAATFLFIWKSHKDQFHSRDFAIGFTLNAIAFGGTWLFHDIAPRVSFLACGLFAMSSVLFYARGVLLRIGISVPTKLFISTQLISIVLSSIALFVYDNVLMTMAITGSISGLQMGIIAYRLHKGAIKDSINSTTVAVVALAGILVPIRLANGLASADTSLTLSNYQSSVEWISLHLLVIVLSTMGALSFILFTLNQAMMAVQKLADTDELTGLNRRNRFEAEARRLFQQVKRTPLPLSLIVMDIDNFKSVNDKHGHLVGDQILKTTGALLKKSNRETDIIGRIGGEEFAILLWNADINGARLVAETIRSTLENHDFSALLGDDNCTASFGVAQLEQGEKYEQLFTLADSALYRAKNNGRNRVNAATFLLEAAA